MRDFLAQAMVVPTIVGTLCLSASGASGDCLTEILAAQEGPRQHLTLSYSGPSDSTTQGMEIEASFVHNDIGAPRRIAFVFYGESGRSSGEVLIAGSGSFQIEFKEELYVTPLFSGHPTDGRVAEESNGFLRLCNGVVAEANAEGDQPEPRGMVLGVKMALQEAFPFIETDTWLSLEGGE